MSAECWGFGESEYTEGWRTGGDTREQAIVAGRDAYPGQVFWIVHGHKPSPAEYMTDVDWILEDVIQRACDEAGEAAETFGDDVTDEAKAELNELLESWATRHLKVNFWIADGKPERIEPEVI